MGPSGLEREKTKVENVFPSGGPHDRMKVARINTLTFSGQLHKCGHGFKSKAVMNRPTLAPGSPVIFRLKDSRGE